MTKQRFEELTGIYISEYQYGIIEEFYLQDGYSDSCSTCVSRAIFK